MQEAVRACIFSGIFFGSWQLTMRGTGLTPFAAAVLLHIGSFLGFFVAFLVSPSYQKEIWSLKDAAHAVILMAIIAGVFNCLGHLDYQKVMLGEVISMSNATAIMLPALLLWVALGDHIFYREALFSWNKLFGLISAVAAVWFLTRER